MAARAARPHLEAQVQAHLEVMAEVLGMPARNRVVVAAIKARAQRASA
jgi:hypothetical protein